MSHDGNPASPRIVVLGIGNLLKGDDGFGVRVIEELERRQLATPLPANVELVDGGTGGPTLLVHFEGAAALIIVDAVNLRQPPGTLRVFSLAEIERPASPAVLSLHELGLAPLLELAGRLGRLPPVVRIVGVQPERFDLGDALSPAVTAAVPRAVEAVLREIAALSQR